jgi:predicted  nucleic acid-binding Zn-ribbon protein
MPAADDSPSKGKDGNRSEQYTIEYYKAQYESIQEELHDFQLSSTELEAEMEKEMEDKEKRERQLREKVDNLRYEVEEWKVSDSLLHS